MPQKKKIERLVERLPEEASWSAPRPGGGCRRRGMPEEEYGKKWETTYRRRYELWLKRGLWQRVLEALGEEDLRDRRPSVRK